MIDGVLDGQVVRLWNESINMDRLLVAIVPDKSVQGVFAEKWNVVSLCKDIQVDRADSLFVSRAKLEKEPLIRRSAGNRLIMWRCGV